MQRPAGWRWAVARDLVMFGGGMWGFIHEVLSRPADYKILIACLTMMGLPVTLESDRQRRRQQEDEP